MRVLFVLVAILALIPFVYGYVKVTLPDYTGPALDMYSGYITVDEKSQRALHYWLIKAETDADKKPLAVWFTGGPGCSGLLGLFLENGPLRVTRTGPGKTGVAYNGITWTKFANMVYIEQPAFVGFSYSNDSNDRQTGDDKAAQDNYRFLQLFVTLEWREFFGRDLWLTGESYAGVYVPRLTNLILKDSTGFLYDQFKGFAIGNPVFSCFGEIGSTGPYVIEQVNLLYWHGFASYLNYKNWTSNGCNDPKQAENPTCQRIFKLIINQIGVIDQEKRNIESSLINLQANTWPSLDPDDIYQDFCTGNGTLDFVVTPLPQTTCDEELGELLSEYLNRIDVQKAIAVVPTEWTQCTDKIDYTINGDSMVPYYLSFFQNKPGVKIMVYSGDIDILTVPFAFTLPCLNQLGATLTSAWQPWFVNGATAGYYEVYDKYTYATIKGAGHEAPQYQPLSSYQLINRFITNGNLYEGNNASQRKIRKYEKQGDVLRRMKIIP